MRRATERRHQSALCFTTLTCCHEKLTGCQVTRRLPGPQNRSKATAFVVISRSASSPFRKMKHLSVAESSQWKARRVAGFPRKLLDRFDSQINCNSSAQEKFARKTIRKKKIVPVTTPSEDLSRSNRLDWTRSSACVSLFETCGTKPSSGCPSRSATQQWIQKFHSICSCSYQPHDQPTLLPSKTTSFFVPLVARNFVHALHRKAARLQCKELLCNRKKCRQTEDSRKHSGSVFDFILFSEGNCHA